MVAVADMAAAMGADFAAYAIGFGLIWLVCIAAGVFE